MKIDSTQKAEQKVLPYQEFFKTYYHIAKKHGWNKVSLNILDLEEVNEHDIVDYSFSYKLETSKAAIDAATYEIIINCHQNLYYIKTFNQFQGIKIYGPGRIEN